MNLICKERMRDALEVWYKITVGFSDHAYNSCGNLVLMHVYF